MEDLNTAPALQPMITGIIRHVQKGTSPTVYSFGFENFGGNLTRTISIFRDQSKIGWTNFLCGRWGVTWKLAQQRHYLKIKSRKSPRLWAIAILKKLLLLRWNMWQFRNTALHSPTGITVISSHHTLNYKIGVEIHRGKDGIDCSNYYLFSPPYTLTNLQSTSIQKRSYDWRRWAWLGKSMSNRMTKSCQAISQQNGNWCGAHLLITYGWYQYIHNINYPI